MENKDLINRVKNIKIEKHFLDIEAPFIPLKDKVILQKINSNFKTKSGLEIIELDKSNRPLGRIIALGPMCSDYLKKGLTVVYDASFWTPLLINGIDYIMCNEPFIDGIITNLDEVHIPTKPVTGEEIKRAERMDRNVKARKIGEKRAENATDKYYDDLKSKRKNPTTFKPKK